MPPRLLLLCLWVLLACLGGLGPEAPSVAAAAPERMSVLLVGNSYTRFNVLPVLVRRIADSVLDGPRMRVDSAARAGYTLRMHWLSSQTRQLVERRRHTHVVLQGHSLAPLERADEFAHYAARFKRLIDASRARTVFYETWARRADAPFYRGRPDVESPRAMQSVIGEVYARLAGDLDALVAPVGQAFAQTDLDAPDLALLRTDGSHPTVLGSYLAALVLYGTVSQVDPRRVTYQPWPVTRSQAQRLRVLASEVLARRMSPGVGQGGGQPATPPRAVASAVSTRPGTADGADVEIAPALAD